ncbi:MAG: acetyltransferase [Armatimonadetes bacterium]|nr:acetyltransferase [Akkermansiaceae bacterium]
MKKILVFGASGYAKVVIDILDKSGEWEISGIIDERGASGAVSWFGYPILGADADLPIIVEEKEVEHGIIAVGDNFLRNKIYLKILSLCPQFQLGTAIHPNASIAKGAVIAEGTVISAGAVVNSDSRIGRCCIVNTRASLDHDSSMGDFSSLAPGVAMGGNVHVGAFSAVCIGAVVKHGIVIGEHSVVGAGSIVMGDIPPLSVSYGQPCRFVRSRKKGEPYLKSNS